jgi:uncharacterized short protein YbdD (DUF466 family)
VIDLLQRGWRLLRELAGDDAYERYLARWQACEKHEAAAPLDRAAFFKAEQHRKWQGLRRCC